MIRRYSELIELDEYEQRLKYLMLGGKAFAQTFGYERWLNQQLYSSDEWRAFKAEIIKRDLGCDLGVEGYEIDSYATVHHINPLTIDDVRTRSFKIFDPENVITTKDSTHKLIHYSSFEVVKRDILFAERTPFDTCPWKKGAEK